MRAQRGIAAFGASLKRGMRSDIGRHGSMVFVATVVLSASNFLYYSLAGRIVDVSGYGALMSLVSLALIVTAPAMVAQNTLGKLVADLVAAGDPRAVARVAREAVKLSLLAALVIFVTAIGLDQPLSNLIHVKDPLLVPLAAVAAAATLVVPVQRGIFQGANRFFDLSGSMLLEALIRMATIVPLARIAGARGGLMAFALSMLGPLVFFAVRSARIWPWPGSGHAVNLRRFSRAVIETGTGFLALMTMLYFDVVLVRHYFNAYDSGLFGATAVVGRAIFVSAAFIPMVLIPKIVARRAMRASVRPVAILGIGVTALAATFGIVIVALFPQRVMGLVSGARYAAAAPYLLPYACAVSLLAGANVAAAVRVGLHRFGHALPLVAIALAEIVIVASRHTKLTDVLWTLIGGHAAALFVLVAFALFERIAASREGTATAETGVARALTRL